MLPIPCHQKPMQAFVCITVDDDNVTAPCELLCFSSGSRLLCTLDVRNKKSPSARLIDLRVRRSPYLPDGDIFVGHPLSIFQEAFVGVT